MIDLTTIAARFWQWLPLIALATTLAGCGGGGHPVTLTDSYLTDYDYGFSSESVAVQPNGNLYAAGTGNSLNNGNQIGITRWTNFGKGARTFYSFPADVTTAPTYIAISPTTGNIYAAFDDSMGEYTPTLQTVTTFQPPQNTGYANTGQITGLVIDSRGNVYQGDGENILEYSADGTYITTLPVSAAGLGETQSLAIDSKDTLYIGSLTTITKMSTSGKVVGKFTCPSDAGADLAIGVDSAGSIYACPSNWFDNRRNLMRYSPSGKVETATYCEPNHSMAVDPAGNVYFGYTSISIFYANKP